MKEKNTLAKSNSNVTVFNYYAERNSAYIRKDKPRAQDVFAPIAALKTTKNNAFEVFHARKIVEEEKLNDFQSRC